MKDFFVSYNREDKQWAEWIAWELEEAGFSVVFQGWDFTGNWMLEMDRAMRETERTVVVLSPHFAAAVYTQPEWVNALRLDPTGAKGLLMPVRVAPVELSGMLAQMVYVDMVDCSQEKARELLLQRARKERGKPKVAPQFPAGVVFAAGLAAKEEGRTIARKPPYPADQEDEKRVSRAVELLDRWRALYAQRLEELRGALIKAEAWRREAYQSDSSFPVDDEMIELLKLTNEVGKNLRGLPVRDLEFAQAYGLQVHETIFSGGATQSALIMASRVEPETLRAMRAMDEQRARVGLQATLVMDGHALEMAERVLRAGVSLVAFSPASLPSGYVVGNSEPLPEDLRRYSNLLLAQVDFGPTLSVFTVSHGLEEVGKLAARGLSVNGLCAQRNSEGTLDVVGQDAHNLYYWAGSSVLPSMQFTERFLKSAAFLSTEPGAEVATLSFNGEVTVYGKDGLGRTTVLQPPGERVEDAVLWVDERRPGAWYLLSCNAKGDVRSALYGKAAEARTALSLWTDPDFFAGYEDYGDLVFKGSCSLKLGVLSGLPCAVVERTTLWGSALQFLHPQSLAPLRPFLKLPERSVGMTLAAERWLVVTLMQESKVASDRIVVWDLEGTGGEPVGRGMTGHGDVYYPTVVAEQAGTSFETIQVFRDFRTALDKNYTVFRFTWPTGKVESLGTFSHFRLQPVILSA